jgi:hypothetical protein
MYIIGKNSPNLVTLALWFGAAHRHKQTQTDTNRHKQTQTDTNRHKQTQTDTNRHKQTQTDTNRKRNFAIRRFKSYPLFWYREGYERIILLSFTQHKGSLKFLKLGFPLHTTTEKILAVLKALL